MFGMQVRMPIQTSGDLSRAKSDHRKYVCVHAPLLTGRLLEQAVELKLQESPWSWAPCVRPTRLESHMALELARCLRLRWQLVDNEVPKALAGRPECHLRHG